MYDVAEQVEHTLVAVDDIEATFPSVPISTKAVAAEATASSCIVDGCTDDDLGDVSARDTLAVAIE